MVRRIDDLKSALILSTALAVAAATTVPLLLPSLPEEARSVSPPLPVFCAALAVQLLVVYGLIGYVGLRLARARGLEPAPDLSALWGSQPNRSRLRQRTLAFSVGLACGVLLVLAVSAIQVFLRGTLPAMLHPPGMVAALLASAAGSLGEEILFRLFLLSCLLRLLPEGRAGTALAVGISALAFGAAHAPALVFLFGGLQEVPLLAWLWLLILNGLLGVAFGLVFLRHGIICAVLTHFGTDVVWHAASQVFHA